MRLGQLLPLLASVCACANLATFQTGRTQGAGELRYGAGADITFVEEFETVTGIDEDQSSEADAGFPVPSLLAWARYGVADNIDMGLRLFTIGVAGEAVTQFLGDRERPFAAAVGLSLAYYGVDVPKEEEDSTGPLTIGGSLGMLDVSTSLHLSYALPDGWLTLYGAPRYISRTVLLGGDVEGEDQALGLDLWGAALGLSFGRDLAFFVEGGVYLPIGFEGLLANLGLGLEF